MRPNSRTSLIMGDIHNMVPFSNLVYARFVTERHLSVTQVNFIHVFLDNLGYCKSLILSVPLYLANLAFSFFT